MSPRLSLSLFAAAAVGVTAAAHAGQVSLVLASVTTEVCTEQGDGYYSYYWSCTPGPAVALAPAQPSGAGSTIDLDTHGNFIGGFVALEAHTEDGIALPAWSRTLVRTPTGGLASTADSGIGPWPPPRLTPESITAAVNPVITRFANQGDFDGEIRVDQDSVVRDAQGNASRTVRHETYAFSSIPGSPLVCPGDRLYVDTDGDGEEDSRDAMWSWLDSPFGSGVDGDGMTIEDFCWISRGPGEQHMRSPVECQRADFRNDEPLRKKPGDCRRVHVDKKTEVCQPAELAQPVAIGARPTCQGYPLFEDADADGEPDATDACPATPAGQAIDSHGCSVAQFCTAQPVLSCKRSDFLNDEPRAKRPGDCQKSTTKPRVCEAAR